MKDVIDELNNYGVFIVYEGELESWLKSRGFSSQSTKGHQWIRRCFENVGLTEDDPNYLFAGTADVWEFIDRIADWASNPHRKGL